jgi:hypothetical protein
VLDVRGQPWPKLNIHGSPKAKYMSVPTLRWWSAYVLGRTDENGRFRIEGLIPGVEYELRAAGHSYQPTLGPGESKDIGDVKY